MSQLTEAGVKRISVGSALANVAWAALLEAGRDFLEEGSLDWLAQARIGGQGVGAVLGD